MDSIKNIIKKTHTNVINDNKESFTNDTNGNSSNGKYALDKNTFTPNTEKTQLAEEIAVFLNDTNNYACFLSVVNKIGVTRTTTLLRGVKEDIKEKAKTKTPVRNPAKYFMWKFKKGLY